MGEVAQPGGVSGEPKLCCSLNPDGTGVLNWIQDGKTLIKDCPEVLAAWNLAEAQTESNLDNVRCSEGGRTHWNRKDHFIQIGCWWVTSSEGVASSLLFEMCNAFNDATFDGIILKVTDRDPEMGQEKFAREMEDAEYSSLQKYDELRNGCPTLVNVIVDKGTAASQEENWNQRNIPEIPGKPSHADHYRAMFCRLWLNHDDCTTE